MPAITLATWRVTFQRESLTDQAVYSQSFSIANGRSPADDLAKSLKSQGYINVKVDLVMTL